MKTAIAIGIPSNVKDFIGPRGIAFQTIVPRRPEGRRPVVTPEVLQKLEHAFIHAYTDKEACLYAGISPSTLYNYQNAHPEFLERKEQLRLSPNLRAKAELVKGIEGSIDQARWWAVHKMADEFAPKTKTEVSGETTIHASLTPEVAKVVEEINAKLREAVAAPHKQA